MYAVDTTTSPRKSVPPPTFDFWTRKRKLQLLYDPKAQPINGTDHENCVHVHVRVLFNTRARVILRFGYRVSAYQIER